MLRAIFKGHPGINLAFRMIFVILHHILTVQIIILPSMHHTNTSNYGLLFQNNTSANSSNKHPRAMKIKYIFWLFLKFILREN